MKVLLLNGSPHREGSTFTALSEVASELEKNGIETEIFWAGLDPVRDCIGCGACKTKHPGRCAYEDGNVNTLIEKLAAADGFIVGAPIYYSSVSAAVQCLLNRMFYSSAIRFKGKPAAGVVVLRRGGAAAGFDRLNKYFTISSMPVVSSQYWNAVHGNNPEEIKQDLEGLQVMRTLARNMSWMLKSFAAGAAAGIEPPETEEKRERTNFIR